MPSPSSDLVKAWCRIDGTDFDAVLPTMIASAVMLASHETGVDYITESMPEAVQQWCAAQVAFWIESPSAAIDRQLFRSPYVDRLLDPYRTYNWSLT